MSYMTICFIIYNPNNLLTRYLADLTHDTGLPTIKGLDFITRTFNVTSPLTFSMKGLFNDFNDLGNQFFLQTFPDWSNLLRDQAVIQNSWSCKTNSSRIFNLKEFIVFIEIKHCRLALVQTKSLDLLLFFVGWLCSDSGQNSLIIIIIILLQPRRIE